MNGPILYSFRRCPYAMRARMAILASGIRCELREVVLRDKPEAMLQASPKGTVPVLLADGKVIDESLDVMLWALQQNDPEGWLGSEDQLTEMTSLIERCQSEFKGHLDRYKYATRYEGVDPVAERELACKFLAELESKLAGSRFLFGAKPRLADVALFPFVRQFANTDGEFWNAAPFPKLRAWLSAWCESESFRICMTKYKQWTPESEREHFPPASATT